MAQRSGLPSILKHARAMCRFIALFTPTIQRLYGGNAALMAALAAANAACEVLATEIEEALPDPV